MIPSEIENALAAAIREARKRSGLSQGQLAGRMAALGFQFHQQTFTKIEGRERTVSLAEALCLAAILRIDLAAFAGALELPPCANCADAPPAGFTCQECGAKGESRSEVAA